ncbi:hypothetical protein scyTo_0019732 [Scyliorhinus torazame]|uniref:Uncharacterized protein n=1 Tax=Scyliorhinus torazame TaxID=75743 RepID=A0A401PPW5_SCYTO|nr:hypothetical protein [Scyliorhinus torazame]
MEFEAVIAKHLDAKHVRITHIQQEYEMKIKGLMPATVRQELEDTISSMKSQVTFLQKRASVLQEELDTYRNRRWVYHFTSSLTLPF